MRKLRKSAALLFTVAMTLSSLVTMDNTYAYTVEKVGAKYHVSDLSENEIKALEEVSVTDLQMLDDIIERSYQGDFQKKTYIVKSKGEELDTTYWLMYLVSRGDFRLNSSWTTGYIAETDGGSYYTVTIGANPSFSPFNWETRTVERWEEYNDRIQQVEKEIGLIDGKDNLCDYQKIQLAYIWIKQNVKYDSVDLSIHTNCAGGQEALEAVLDGYALCAGYARIFNRFMHDCGIDSYWVSLASKSHAGNLFKFDGIWYGADLQTGRFTCDPGYEEYNSNGKLIWDMYGIFGKIQPSAYNDLKEIDAIMHYYDGDFVWTNDNGPEFFGTLQEIEFPNDITCNSENPEGKFLKEGRYDAECDVCGRLHEFPIMKAHAYKTVEVKQPTCTEEGFRRKVCTVCGDETTEVLEKTAHNYEIYAGEPTCRVKGSFIIKCKDCGDVYYREDIEQLEHTMSDWYQSGYNGWEYRYCENPEEEEIAWSGENYVEYRNIYTGEVTLVRPTADAVDPNRDEQTETITQSETTAERQTTNVTETTTPEMYTTVKNEQTTGTRETTAKNPETIISIAATSSSERENTTTAVPTKIPEAATKAKYPAKVTIKSAKNKAKKSIFVTWKKTKKAKKYQIQYSLNKKFAKGVKLKTTKKLTYRMKGLTKSKTYYVRVRGVNGKNYGKWSRISKVKIKK